MRSDSERDISKAKSEGDCRARSAGGGRSIAAMGAVEVAGGERWRGVADAWRCIGGQSPCLFSPRVSRYGIAINAIFVAIFTNEF